MNYLQNSIIMRATRMSTRATSGNIRGISKSSIGRPHVESMYIGSGMFSGSDSSPETANGPISGSYFSPQRGPMSSSPAATRSFGPGETGWIAGDDSFKVSTPSFKPNNHWVIGDVLGSGSHSAVFRTLDKKTGQVFALKRVRLCQHGTIVYDFAREISFLERLHHKNIVHYLGNWSDEEFVYIGMRMATVGSISSMLKSFGPFDLELVKAYVRQILEGLCYLHSQHVSHLDLKGANVLIDSDGTAMLSDFGAAKAMQTLPTIETDICTSTINSPNLSDSRDTLRGTVFWMAPEVIRQNVNHGGEQYADIWSLGCTVIEMATAEHPWAKHIKDPIAALYFIGSGNQAPPMPDCLHQHEDAVHFVRSCLLLDPALRPSSQELLTFKFIR